MEVSASLRAVEELGMSLNAVLIAKSRVLSRLHQEAEDSSTEEGSF
jgi:hypothetical protein